MPGISRLSSSSWGTSSRVIRSGFAHGAVSAETVVARLRLIRLIMEYAVPSVTSAISLSGTRWPRGVVTYMFSMPYRLVREASSSRTRTLMSSWRSEKTCGSSPNSAPRTCVATSATVRSSPAAADRSCTCTSRCPSEELSPISRTPSYSASINLILATACSVSRSSSLLTMIVMSAPAGPPWISENVKRSMSLITPMCPRMASMTSELSRSRSSTGLSSM